MIYIGVDPGLTGAIAFLSDGRSPFVVDMPVQPMGGIVSRAMDPRALARIARDRTLTVDVTVKKAFSERVSAFPGQGVASMFSLGMSYWGAYSVLAALDIPITLVEPKEWKSYFKLDRDKSKSISLAKRLFPGVELTLQKHHGRAEALLIAQYGKLMTERI